MGYITHRNRGSIVESLMTNTAEYYRAQKIAYFRKSNPEYMHISRKNRDYSGLPMSNNFQVRLTSKGDLDFYGVYKGRYVSIELKETQQEVFSLALLKEHQYLLLEEIHSCGGVSLLLIHFLSDNESFWVVTFPQLKALKKNRKTKIEKAEFQQVGAYQLEITYPYILNLSPILDQILLNS